ncbi:MAG: tRNA (adenosine(37)-N6)-dimethylallyltransferase MiaA [Alphaproteobacteria bacterium]|nr:tRNA (adenosine(37)-N6)-dimethylallyltransferase MiaA [Alphaproteobacteria bacterium]
MKNGVIVIAGPTASGKSQLAIDLALALNGVILNADSMQIYKETPILSAVPSFEDKQLVEHRLYELYDNNFKGSVINWLDNIVPEIKKVWQENKIPFVVGGTGLYLDNLINGTTPVPETSEKVHKETIKLLSEIGVNALYQKLKEVDLETARRLSPNDTTRVRRAYEVWSDTHIPLSEWHKKQMIKKIPEARFFVIRLLPSQAELDERCYLRFDKMIEKGALKEVETLFAKGIDNSSPSMKALGVPELLSYKRGEIKLDEALSLAKLHTRQYAKRQLTWFKSKLKSNFDICRCYQTDENLLKNIIFNVKNQI